MKVCIHRGTHQVGGTCIEIRSGDMQIILDIGLPFDSDLNDTALPPVSGRKIYFPVLKERIIFLV